MTSGVPEDPLAIARAIRARYAPQEGIDPRVAAVLQRREARAAEQEQMAARDERQTPWEALARAGAAMAGSNSLTFGGGLSAGVGAALDTVQKRRAEAVRQRMAAGELRDSADLERVNQEDLRRKRAREEMGDDFDIADKQSAIEARAAQARRDLAAAQQIEDPRMRALAVRKAEAEVLATQMLAEERRTASVKNLRPDAPSVGGGSRQAGVLEKRVASYKSKYDMAAALYNANASDPMWVESEAGKKVIAQMRANARQVNRAAQQYMNLTGEDLKSTVPYNPISNPAPVQRQKNTLASNDPLGLRR